MAALQQSLKLNNGATIPVLGFGTWQSDPGVVGVALREAIKAGFRHIDCARVYRNEPELGEVFSELLDSGAIKREDLFITSKLWNTDHRPEHVEEACRKTLQDLKVGYLDLYLMHWPANFRHPEKFETVEDWFPKNEKGGTHQDPVPIAETWAAMEKLVDQGLVKSIGISNFNEERIRELFKTARIKPVCNQIEVQPALPQEKLRAVNKEFEMVTQSYCPLGIGFTTGPTQPEKTVMEDPQIQEIAKKANISPAQLLLRWNLQMGNVVLTKSVTPSRIVENANTVYGQLSPDTMEALRVWGKENPWRCVNPKIFYETERPFFGPDE